MLSRGLQGKVLKDQSLEESQSRSRESFCEFHLLFLLLFDFCFSFNSFVFGTILKTSIPRTRLKVCNTLKI